MNGAYAIFLTIVLVNNSVIEVGKILYFDDEIECRKMLKSDKYILYLDIRFGGVDIKNRNSWCDRVNSI